MKTYIKPALTTINVQTVSMLAASGEHTETIGKGESGGNGIDLTRGKQGFGKGMWEDMK